MYQQPHKRSFFVLLLLLLCLIESDLTMGTKWVVLLVQLFPVKNPHAFVLISVRDICSTFQNMFFLTDAFVTMNERCTKNICLID